VVRGVLFSVAYSRTTEQCARNCDPAIAREMTRSTLTSGAQTLKVATEKEHMYQMILAKMPQLKLFRLKTIFT